MLGHLSLGVSDLEHSGRFYDAVLAAIGWVRVWDSPRGIGYGAPGGGDRIAIFPHPDTTERLAAGPGFHLALDAPDHAAVDRFHAAALASGGASYGEPGLRPHYGASYYAAFVTDPDGHKLEVVNQ